MDVKLRRPHTSHRIKKDFCVYKGRVTGVNETPFEILGQVRTGGFIKEKFFGKPRGRSRT